MIDNIQASETVSIRYGVIHQNGSLKFKSFAQLNDARDFFDKELRAMRDCKMVKYDLSKHSTSYVKEKMISMYV